MPLFHFNTYHYQQIENAILLHQVMGWIKKIYNFKKKGYCAAKLRQHNYQEIQHLQNFWWALAHRDLLQWSLFADGTRQLPSLTSLPLMVTRCRSPFWKESTHQDLFSLVTWRHQYPLFLLMTEMGHYNLTPHQIQSHYNNICNKRCQCRGVNNAIVWVLTVDHFRNDIYINKNIKSNLVVCRMLIYGHWHRNCPSSLWSWSYQQICDKQKNFNIEKVINLPIVIRYTIYPMKCIRQKYIATFFPEDE